MSATAILAAKNNIPIKNRIKEYVNIVDVIDASHLIGSSPV
jgi:hypothetical protein